MTGATGMDKEEQEDDDSEDKPSSTLTDDELEARIRALGLGEDQELTDKSTGVRLRHAPSS
jgi:hypothetical protein